MSGRSEGRAFIGSFTSAGGRGIITAEVAEKTGALTEIAATDVLANPSFLALAPDGSVLYAVSESKDGAAAAFTTGAPGSGNEAPQLIGSPQPVRAAGPAHLTLTAGHLVTANYGSGSVTVLPVGSDGALRAAGPVLEHRGRGPHPDRQSGPHAHQVVADPSGRWVLSVDLGTDSVRICALDPDTVGLTLIRETALRAGTGPRHLAFHPAGSHAYVLNELEPTLTVCRWDAGAGVLEPVREVTVVPAEARGESFPSEVVVSQDGRFVWAAVRGQDSIAVLTLDGRGEVAELTATVDCGGRWPRHLTLDPSGRRLYAANERSGEVTWFDVAPRTGVPVRSGSLAAPAASCVIFG